MIHPAQEPDAAIRQIVAQVSRFIHAGPSFAAEGIGNEHFSRQLRALEISAGHTVSADTDFARNPNGYWLTVGVQQVDLRVGDRTAYGVRTAGDPQSKCRVGRRLSRAVNVEHPLDRPGL